MSDAVLGLKTDSPPRGGAPADPRAGGFGWRTLWWFGLLFLIIGLADMALVWYPMRPGNPAWEFGAIDLSFSTLPVLTIGFASLLAATTALARIRLAYVLAIAGILMGLMCLGAYVIFLTDVPVALRGAPPEVVVGIKKALARNTVFAGGFGATYLGAGIATWRHLRRRGRAA